MALGRANAMVDDLVSLAMEDGFDKSLLELAKANENKTGPWLDSIESQVMETLKGSLATSAGISPDASSVTAAAEQMQNFFRGFREGLEKE